MMQTTLCILLDNTIAYACSISEMQKNPVIQLSAELQDPRVNVS